MGVWNAVIERDTLIEREKKIQEKNVSGIFDRKKIIRGWGFFNQEAAGIISECPLEAMISCV